MFVYKKGALKRKIEPVGDDRAKYILKHEPTGVEIMYEFQIDNFDPQLNLAMKNGRVSMTKPFVIYGLKDDGKYKFYIESFDPQKNLLNNWKDAISIFESKIFEFLNETPPNPTPPEPPKDDDKDKDPPKKFSELPRVGDIVKTGNQFGRVVDVNEDTREIKIEPLTEEQARDILRGQREAMAAEASQPRPKFNFSDLDTSKGAEGILEQLKKKGFRGNIIGLEKGGAASDGFISVVVDEQGSNVFIIRPTLPAPPSGDGTPPPDDDRRQPDNVIDLDPPKDGQGGQGGQDGQDGQDDPRGDQGDDQDGPKSDEPTPTPSDFGDDEEEDLFGGFGSTDEDLEQALDELKNRKKEKEKRLKEELQQAADDLKVVEVFLGRSKEEIKNTFSRRQAQNLLGTNVFEDATLQENVNRINNALNLIFK